MADSARGVHVSPGVYSKESVLTYAVKSLGITTLGIVGETLKGPAFEPISISNWREFENTFGGTSTEKFKSSQYPKYELPYIAKSYLKESEQLEVVRVLGLSGYQAGPAWAVTAKISGDYNDDAKGTQDSVVVAVLRSRGEYYKYRKYETDATGATDCSCQSAGYDELVYNVGEVLRDADNCDGVIKYNPAALELAYYNPLYSSTYDCEDVEFTSYGEGFEVSSSNYGRFKINGLTGTVPYGVSYSMINEACNLYKQGSAATTENTTAFYTKYKDIINKQYSGNTSVTGNDGKDAYLQYVKYSGNMFTYAVSLNSTDKDYIIDVLGQNPSDGDAPIFVESIYDVALAKAIAATNIDEHVTEINSKLSFYQVFNTADFCGIEPVGGIIEMTESSLSRKYVGQRFLADRAATVTGGSHGSSAITYHVYDYATDRPITTANSATTLTDWSGRTYSYAIPCRDWEKVETTAETSFSSVTWASNSAFTKDYYTKLLATDSISSALTNKENGRLKEPSAQDKVIATISRQVTPKYSYNVTNIGATASTDVNTGKYFWDEDGYLCGIVEIGHIYTVVQYTDSEGKRHYFYRAYDKESVDRYAIENAITNFNYPAAYDYLMNGGREYTSTPDSGKTVIWHYDVEQGNLSSLVCVKNLSDGLYYRLIYNTVSGEPTSVDDVTYVTCDLNNYKEQYRYASTPWIVSNLMGDYNNIEVKKLFRFHTISDGNGANNEVKVSIENIRPDEGVFDVVIRDINDADEYQTILEKYSRCSLTVGASNYIAYKMGSYDGIYEAKSKYATVEVIENDVNENLSPAGFLGYPMAQFGGVPVVNDDQLHISGPKIFYNQTYDEDIKNRKQYFGLSSTVGVDIDMFTYKGKAAYIDSPSCLTHGFHMDSRLNFNGYSSGSEPTITVDGVQGYKFDAVSQNNRTSILTDPPVIGSEESMTNTIYNYVNLRKFTVYFYGGFDGWDEYRTERTNTDDFKQSKYIGTYDTNSGEGYSFDKISNPDSLGLNQAGITSDWYAYLAGYRQFANPEAVDINIFATPGIDYVNNKLLVDEVVEMIEEERADSIYVVTTPDKPSGAYDYVDEMYTPDDVVYNLEDSELDSNYTCTYYPWVKYLDTDNNQYIYLPPTKDVVRNLAMTDNTTQSWYAPAGLSRGDVDCVKAHYITKLADEDTLYEGRINPIKTFAADGVKVWGQKNLQTEDNQLNRIAVRRLLLRMRKLIAIACRQLIFEPNDTTTKSSFLSAVTPILDNIRSNRGISAYQIEVDDSEEARERRELPAKIFFKPYNALEYIALEFVVTPESVSFDDI